MQPCDPDQAVITERWNDEYQHMPPLRGKARGNRFVWFCPLCLRLFVSQSGRGAATDSGGRGTAEADERPINRRAEGTNERASLGR